MSYVYILKSQRDGRYYIGSTSDLDSRIKNHFWGGTHSTKRFGDLELVFKQKFDTLDEARKIERKIKKLKRKDYVEKIISDGFIKIGP